jgi:AraC-like DNA-binding protein
MNNSIQSITLDPNVIELLVAFVEKQGMHCPDFCEKLSKLRSNHRLPIEVWWSLLDELYVLNPRPDLGLAIGQCVQPQHAGVLGYLGMYSSTLGQALMRFHRFQPLLHNLVPTHFRAEGHTVILGWGTERRSTPLSDDVVGAGLMRFMHLLTGREDLRPSLIKSPNPPSKRNAFQEQFYGCKVEYVSCVNEFHFPASYMALPVNTQDPCLSALLERQAEAMMQGLPKQDPLLTEIQKQVLSLMQDGPPEMVEVAQRMGMAERSLYRALQERGVRFKELVSTIRFEMAKDYLKESTLSLPEIALLIGFADQSVLTRAFKQWSGETPLKWRKANRIY